MSFPRYAEYRDSGVEWLGAVPAHWVLTNLKRVVQQDRAITYGIVQAGPHIEDGVPYIRPADMSEEDGVRSPDDVLRTSIEIADSYSRSRLRAGDLVCSIGPSFGKVMITPKWLDGANLTQGTARVAIAEPNSPRFVFWVLRSGSAIAQWESSIGGATFRALNLGPLAETALALPSPAEQTAIAAFLDHETAQIDALVAEQQRLVELLKEKRQAVISHAVTKGLNPDAPMKDSGVEWLGEVPAHWEVGSVGYYVSVLSGFAFPSAGFTQDDSHSKLLRGTNLTVGRLRWDDVVYWKRQDGDGLDEYELRDGDLVVGMDRPLVSDGMRVATVTSADLPCLLLQRVVSIRSLGAINLDFLKALLSSPFFIAHFSPDTTGVSVPHISPDQIKKFAIPIPPLSEQDAIADHLAAQATSFDALIAEATRAIDLLNERRTALISAAVTGQIDVRGLAGRRAA